MNGHNYSVTARLSPPDFAGERRYVMMETEVAQRELKHLPARSWLPFSYPALGLLRREDWRKYIRALEKYGHSLDLLEQEIASGLLPLSFNVTHTGARPDQRIRVHIMVDQGHFYLAKKPLKRPNRVDGAPNKSDTKHFYGFEQGFVRHGIHMGWSGIEAQFSRLEAHDSALVINQPVYVGTSPHTGLSYEISSLRLPHGERGEIPLPR